MYGWLLTVSSSAIVLFVLEQATNDGPIKKAARFAFGIMFMAIFLRGLLSIWGGSA